MSRNDKAVALYRPQLPTSSRDDGAQVSSLNSLELEDGTRQRKRTCHSYIFPVRPFRWCPNILCIYFPDTLKEIQDFTHLSLALGTIALIAMVVQVIVTIVMHWSSFLTWKQLLFSREALTVILFVTISPYCWTVLAQYDQRLVDKQAEAKRQKESLSVSYQALCSEMHNTLEKFAEFTGAYAQNIFENKYRAFSHWAKQMATALEQETRYMNPKEKEEIKEEYKKMCMNWFRVLSECGINPAERPVILCKKEELDQFETFTEIAKCVQERCIPPKIAVERRTPKSELWTAHMKGRCANCEATYTPAQASAMKGKCQTCSRKVIGLTYWLEEMPVWSTKRPGSCLTCKEWFSPEQARDCDGMCPRCKVEIVELTPVTQELAEQQRAFRREEQQATSKARRLSRPDESARALAAAGHPRRRCLITWLRCGACACSRTTNTNSRDGYPVQYHCCCIILKVFSRDHIKLMIGFSICLVLVVLNVGWMSHGHIVTKDEGERSWYTTQFTIRIVENILIQISLLVLLIRFEDLDAVQQLETNINQLKEETARVENTNKTVQETFGLLQKMNCVWLNRTIPRLDLVNEISNKLCDCDQSKSRAYWVKANNAIETMEKKIGCLQDWVGDDKLGDLEKKKFEKRIKAVYQEHDMDKMINGLNQLSGESLGFLAALTPPQDDQPMVNLHSIRDPRLSVPTQNAQSALVVTTVRRSEAPLLDV